MAGDHIWWLEVLVCSFFVLISTLAPLWSARKAKAAKTEGIKVDSKREFVFAGGGATVSMFAIVMSVSRGTLGVRSFLGYPSELVYHGSALWETVYGICFALPLVGWLFVPFFLNLETTSIYEYLELRFSSRCVRRMTAATFIVRQVLTLALTVYAPAVALHAALGFPLAATAALTAAIAATATALGGLAAALRADMIQAMSMVVLSLVFIVQGTWRAGGVATVLDKNIRGERLKFFSLSSVPGAVDTVSATIGQLFVSLSVFGCQQTFAQRYVALGSISRAKRALWLTVPAVFIMFSLSWVVGMTIYAIYANCDPMAKGLIVTPDEVLPFYVRDQFNKVPGVLGLFLGAIFNGALSFLVSNVNSLATVTWEDFLSNASIFKGISDYKQVIIIKTCGVGYCIAVCGLALVAGQLGGAAAGSLLVSGATGGALLGVFALAAAMPLAGPKAATIGMLSSHALTLLFAGSYFIRKDAIQENSVALVPNSDVCQNITGPVYDSTLIRLPPFLDELSSVSYMWYTLLGASTCVVVGTMVGLCGEPFSTQARFLHPTLLRLIQRWPLLARHIKDDEFANISVTNTPNTSTNTV